MSPPSSKIPSKLSHLIKPEVASASQAAKALKPETSTPRRRKRPFSEVNLSPSDPEKSPKMSKLELNDIKEQLKVQSETFTSQMQASHDNLMKAIQASSDNLNQSLGIKIATENQIIVSNLSHQMSEIKSRQDQESLARQDIETKVTGLQAQYGNVSDQLDRLATQPPVVDHAELARLLLPQVTADLSGQLKTHNHQAKATYFQSLVNEIKEHETGMMI